MIDPLYIISGIFITRGRLDMPKAKKAKPSVPAAPEAPRSEREFLETKPFQKIVSAFDPQAQVLIRQKMLVFEGEFRATRPMAIYRQDLI